MACEAKATREREALVLRLAHADCEISRLRARVAEREAHAADADRMRHAAVVAAASASDTAIAATSRCNDELRWHTLRSELASEQRHRVAAERERDTALGAVDRLLTFSAAKNDGGVEQTPLAIAIDRDNMQRFDL